MNFLLNVSKLPIRDSSIGIGPLRLLDERFLEMKNKFIRVDYRHFLNIINNYKSAFLKYQLQNHQQYNVEEYNLYLLLAI